MYIYRLTGGTWTQTARLKPSNAGNGSEHKFGESLALSANGLHVAVGAKGDAYFGTSIVAGNSVTSNFGNPNSGAVHVFKYNGTQWNQEAYIKASNSAQDMLFGTAVSINDFGTRIAVGATGKDAEKGAAYVYRRSGTTWTEEEYISNASGDANDHFGNAVSISGNGNTLAIGVEDEDSDTTGLDSTANNNATDSGAVYLYHRSGTNWTQEEYIKADNPDSYDHFGISVKMNYSGGFLAVGSRLERADTIGVYDVGSNSNSTSPRGAVYIFRRVNGTLNNWAQKAYVKGIKGDFGYAIGLSNDAKVMGVGAPYYSPSTGASSIHVGDVDVY